MLVGLFIGQFVPVQATKMLVTFADFFGKVLEFSIPFIIIFFITHGIASINRNSGKTLGITVGFAYLSTVAAGLLAAAVGIVLSGHYSQSIPHSMAFTTDKLEPYFFIEVEPIMGVMSALLVAFIFGIGAQATRSTTIQQIAKEGAAVIELFLKRIIIPLLPFYIAAIFADMAHDGSVYATLKTYGLVLLLAIGLHWIYLFSLFIMTGLFSGYNPFKALWLMMPAYFTAIGTMSSSATIPVSLRQTQRLLRHPAVAEFTVPLCATIHLAGSTITLVGCAIAVMIINGGATPTLTQLLPFILMLAVTMVAAPGVPGGGVIAALGILSSMLGFNEEMLGLMIALYVAQDSFGTACNVTGDAAIAMVVEKCCVNEPLINNSVTDKT